MSSCRNIIPNPIYHCQHKFSQFDENEKTKPIHTPRELREWRRSKIIFTLCISQFLYVDILIIQMFKMRSLLDKKLVVNLE